MSDLSYNVYRLAQVSVALSRRIEMAVLNSNLYMMKICDDVIPKCVLTQCQYVYSVVH